MNYLVTGAAGFIGFHICQKLLSLGHCVTGLDNLNQFYDVSLKRDRLEQISSNNFSFEWADVSDRKAMERLFSLPFDTVIHLAAQASVRYSITNPETYIDSNLVGFANILEGCRKHKIPLVYASSSSVYGANHKLPYSTDDRVDHPISLYAATKKANELMAHSYSHLYGIPTIGLRFFTVYGPWGRPDMAVYKFTKAIAEERPVQLYNHGNLRRDFTYIDDIAEGVVRTSLLEPASGIPYRILNIGATESVGLVELVQTIGEALGKEPIIEYEDMQAGDVLETCADVSDLSLAIDFKPSTSIQEGIKLFVEWYRNYHA